MNTTIDYDAIANQIETRSAAAAHFLRCHTGGRKVGMRRTTLRTVIDKLSEKAKPFDRLRAERVLHILSELGLGSVVYRHRLPEIEWNCRINILELGFCLIERSTQRRRLRDIESVCKGHSVVCLMPCGSFDALLATGIIAKMEIELLKR